MGRMDCGRLCQKCCSGTSEDGMFLLPEKRPLSEILVQTEKRSNPHREHLFFLTCSGTCPGKNAPWPPHFSLAAGTYRCRELELQLDSMGLFLCPLVQADNIELLHPAFRRRAMRAWKLLLGDPLLYELVRKASAAKQKQEPWEKLCKMR